LVVADQAGLSDAELGIIRRSGWGPEGRVAQQSGGPPGTGVDWLLCRDSAWRPVESGTCPLVDASPARMGRLRGYGDAIDVETFTNLIAAYMEIAP
jgi:DNA (cytosine-5)-methyltransferase 1